jgi:hypothetical protein
MLWILLAGLGLPLQAAPKGEQATLHGRVVELTAALKSLDIKADTEPISRQVVLRAADGKVTPLLADEASRALFLDERLRDRPLQIQGRRFAGLPYLQVISFQIEHNGKLRTPEYYCEVCSIRVRYPQTCPCCQGPMVLRLLPEE